MISVLFGYRGDDGPRDVLFANVLRWWKVHYNDAQICMGRNFDQPFNRGKARNEAFKDATGDIIIVADADTLPTVDGVDLAIEEILEGRARWMLPYGPDRYYNLSEERTKSILNSGATTIPEPVTWEHKITSWAGCLIMPRAAYEAVGGYDERFVGWGYEDNAFQFALDTIWGPHARIDSFCCHLWHAIEPGTTFDSPTIGANRALFGKYQAAVGRPEDMKEVRCDT